MYHIDMGMLNHLMTWIEDFQHHHSKAIVFGRILDGTSLFPNFIDDGIAYQEYLQWSRKEIWHFGRIIHLVQVEVLHSPPPLQRAVSWRASTCVWVPVYRNPVVCNSTHPNKTLKHIPDCKEDLRLTNHIVTPYQSLRLSHSIYHYCIHE